MNILRLIAGTSNPIFPKFYGSGIRAGKYFAVLQLLGKSVFELSHEREKAFKMHTVCWIGTQIIGALESLHELGYVHLDLKPENIMTEIGVDCEEMEFKVFLIDFGISKSFREEDGSHIELKKQKVFKGSILFASKYAFKKYK